MDVNDLSDNLTNDELKDWAVNYLLESGFVDAYVKKLMYREDLQSFYEEFRQETWLAILELKAETWRKLYESSKQKGVGFDYEIRNYSSRVISNTVRSTSSNAYRKIKKPSVRERTQDSTKWDVLAQQLTEPKSVLEQIVELNNR